MVMHGRVIRSRVGAPLTRVVGLTPPQQTARRLRPPAGGGTVAAVPVAATAAVGAEAELGGEVVPQGMSYTS